VGVGGWVLGGGVGCVGVGCGFVVCGGVPLSALARPWFSPPTPASPHPPPPPTTPPPPPHFFFCFVSPKTAATGSEVYTATLLKSAGLTSGRRHAYDLGRRKCCRALADGSIYAFDTLCEVSRISPTGQTASR